MRFIKEKKIIDATVKINFFENIFSSFFFTGYFPKASGTVASAASLLIFYFKFFQDPFILFILIAVCFIAGIYTSKVMIKRFGDDPSVVVIDEAVGMWLTVLIYMILHSIPMDLFQLTICFFAFRFFDITKIQPAKYFDKLNSGFGIMMDDVIAGVYAGLLAYVIIISYIVILTFYP
ncbi:MAG: phosphatidylglycerophosphatase A [Ignavibacteria bacterium]|nr:phosphatidylglycerophosphatase A [Ignavibacteria bacterium]